MSSYFQKHANKLKISAEGIRNCQRGAFYATLAHFTRSSQPCLIGLPTGSGKTALMIALCFGLKARRALIITPATILRGQTAEKFRTLQDLKNAGALPSTIKGPKVRNNEHEFQDSQDWNECKAFDVVVATTKTTSPKERRIDQAPIGLFDVIFLDEAHHTPASTWVALLESFQGSDVRAVLLTGTPYRRDHIEIPAELIYSYPISRAIEDRIFAPVKFIDAGRPGSKRDSKLIKKGLNIWRQAQKESKEKPLLLIKTDRIRHADDLCKLYNKLGANVSAVHTRFSQKENLATLDSLKKNSIDGIIAVGMLGEGLDVPELKVAVFHRNPQSLPHTLQVIGRLARTGTQITHGSVVGFSDDFSRETFKLYDASPDWFRLIPDLEKKLIAGRVGVASEEALKEGQNFLYNSDLTLFFSVSVFEFKAEARSPDMGKIYGWRKDGVSSSTSVEKVSVFENDTFVAITKRRRQPDWVRTGGYSRVIQESFDLHVFFQHKHLVIEHTTSSDLAAELRRELFGDDLVLIKRDKLNNVMRDGDGAYIVVGLRNSGGFSQLNPTYKMHMGAEAQATVTNADSKSFHIGHCLMRLKRDERDSETRGIAYKRGRIWELKRNNLRVFREWCLQLAQALLGKEKVALPGLERLRKTEELRSFTQKPLAVVHNTALLTRRVAFLAPTDTVGISDYTGLPEISVESFSESQVVCNFAELGVKFSVLLDENSEVTYEQIDGTEYTIRVDPVENVIRDFPLASFLREFPPRMIFSDGSTLTDGLYSKPIIVPELDPSLLRKIDWTGCDIDSEVEDTAYGVSVHKFVKDKYIQSNMSDLLVIRDHAAGELADFITIDLSRKNVTFYHMKSASTLKGRRLQPGARKHDLEDLLAQVICSGRWVKNISLGEEISRRLKERDATNLVQGTQITLTRFLQGYTPLLWGFEVIAVQPALAANKVTKPIKTMIASAQDYLAAAGAHFEILCSH